MVTVTTEAPDDVVFRHDEIELARYRADSEASKPHFSTIAPPAGGAAGQNLVLTAPHDHTWHHGLFFCQKLIDGINCWESEMHSDTDRIYGYAESGQYDVSEADEYAELTQEATWKSSIGESLLDDRRTIRLYEPRAEGYVIDWEQTLSPVGRSRHLSSESFWGRYGGLCIRFVRDLTGGDIRLPEETNPDPNDDTTGPWCDYSGLIDGDVAGQTGAGITLMNHESNQAYYPHWFTRNEEYGLLTANPVWDRIVPVTTGESITWRWGLWIHSGRPERARIEEVYRTYCERHDE